jgi:hypothetical protein
LKVKLLYQTLEDRGNPDEISANAPFPCHWENTWLGDGFYFWDTFIENAHWWGEVRYKKKHVICQAVCDVNDQKCFDLVGDTDHMIQFQGAIEKLKQEGLLDENTTVARVIHFLKDQSVSFPFEAIRVYGIKSISEYSEAYKDYRYRLIFEIDKPQYLDYKPAIQLCIFKKNGLNLRDVEIVYPDEYIDGYVI